MQNLLTTTNLIYLTLALLLITLILFIWLWRVTSHYNRLIKSAKKKTLTQLLEGVQQTLATHEKRMGTLKSDLSQLEADAKLHIQNVTLKRFNPFSDTGGDQSFILALLDENKDGVVITSLHSRENTRFYVKSVKGGVGVDHLLSEEEQKVVNKRKR